MGIVCNFLSEYCTLIAEVLFKELIDSYWCVTSCTLLAIKYFGYFTFRGVQILRGIIFVDFILDFIIA